MAKKRERRKREIRQSKIQEDAHIRLRFTDNSGASSSSGSEVKVIHSNFLPTQKTYLCKPHHSVSYMDLKKIFTSTTVSYLNGNGQSELIHVDYEHHEDSCSVDNEEFRPYLHVSHSVGTQTDLPKRIKRRNCRQSSSALLYYKPPSLRFDHLERVSVRRTCEVCTSKPGVVSKIKNHHGKYPSQLPTQIIDFFRWLGDTIKRVLVSLYPQKSTPVNCNNCTTYPAALISSFESLRSDISSIKEQNKENWESLNQELRNFEANVKSSKIVSVVASPPLPPPPPPPPPPPLPPSSNVPVQQPKVKEKKNTSKVAKPIISVEDILNVKLRKIGEHPNCDLRCVNEPNLANSQVT